MNEDRAFLDANIILRHLLQDLPDQAARATALFQQVESGSLRLVTTETMVRETVFVLGRHYCIPREDVAQALTPLLALPGIELAARSDVLGAFDLWVARPGLSFADCLHITNARRMTGGRIYSFDRKIGSVEGVARLEP